MALTEKLTNIAVAIREKTGTEDKLTLEQMATAIAGIETGGGSGGEDGVPETISFTGSQLDYTFQDNKWKWFLDNYSDRIQTSGITSCKYIFSNSYRYTIDFIINTSNTTSGCSFTYAFNGCQNLTAINTPLKNISDVGNMFNGCTKLRELPELTFKTGGISGHSMFLGCRSLRKVPEETLKAVYSNAAYYSHPFTNMFQGCSAIDEIKGLNPKGGSIITINVFGNWGFGVSSGARPQRLKEFTFTTNDDGTPITVSWHSQNIDLSGIGVTVTPSYILDYNSGITKDKEVKTASDYERLKNDPDWYSGVTGFSRYNLQSAINTINSLPDASAYLLTQSGKTNTIKFNYNEGANTDGGKIGDMTEEQIAVATAKGWTVSITQQ